MLSSTSWKATEPCYLHARLMKRVRQPFDVQPNSPRSLSTLAGYRCVNVLLWWTKCMLLNLQRYVFWVIFVSMNIILSEYTENNWKRAVGWNGGWYDCFWIYYGRVHFLFVSFVIFDLGEMDYNLQCLNIVYALMSQFWNLRLRSYSEMQTYLKIKVIFLKLYFNAFIYLYFSRLQFLWGMFTWNFLKLFHYHKI